MDKPEPFVTDKLPRPRGPYSQAVKAGGFLFVSGMVPIYPETGQPCAGSIQEQVRVTLDNLKTLLHEAGASLEQVVKTTAYLADATLRSSDTSLRSTSMGQFQAMNEVYASYFPANPPARTTIEAAGLPMDVLVEIDAVAWLGERG